MLVVDEQGKEPGGWELYRGMERIEVALQSLSQGMLPMQIFLVEKAQLNSRIDGAMVDILELKAQHKVDALTASQNAKELEGQKARNRQFVIALIATPVLGGIVTYAFAVAQLAV